jgi:hypothetical protein
MPLICRKTLESPLLAKRGEDLGVGIEPANNLNIYGETTDSLTIQRIKKSPHGLHTETFRGAVSCERPYPLGMALVVIIQTCST